MATSNNNNNATALYSRSTDIATPVTHSTRDFFERPSVLVNYEGSFNQDVFNYVGCRGPQLAFL